jgi:hypothetical protein
MDLANCAAGCGPLPLGVRIVILVLVAALGVGYLVLGILKWRDRK